MMHPDTELRFVNSSIGQGVFATRPIPKGTITWAFDPLDQIVSNDFAARLHPAALRQLIKYSYVTRLGRVLCWDHARFMNHSCDSCCLATGFDFEIAVRDIEAGEELTDDYGALNLEAPLLCECGTSSCRGTIAATDLLRFGDDWDTKVAGAFTRLRAVPQPLWSLVHDVEEIDCVLQGKRDLPSCRIHYITSAV
jgi:hypothetical protein